MRITSLTIASAIALAAAGHAADASAPTINNRLWTHSGNGCVVADESAGLYDTRLAGIGFLSGKSGTIREYCPISISTNGTSPSINGFAMSYHEDLTAGQTITATLWKVNDGSNSASGLCTLTGSISAGGFNVDACSWTGALSKTATYWIEIDVTRSSGSSADPEVYSVFVYN